MLIIGALGSAMLLGKELSNFPDSFLPQMDTLCQNPTCERLKAKLKSQLIFLFGLSPLTLLLTSGGRIYPMEA